MIRLFLQIYWVKDIVKIVKRRVKLSGNRSYLKYCFAKFYPLIIIVAAVFSLKFYLAIRDPILNAADPWYWALEVERIKQGSFVEYIAMVSRVNGIFTAEAYPKVYPLLITLIALIARTSGYEVVRFYPIISALNLIPLFFLSLLISKSRGIATVSIIFVTLSKWYAIRTSIGNAECFTHFWLAFSLFFLLRLRYAPTWRNVTTSIFFITMTVMFWAVPIAIYVVFLPLLVIINILNRTYLTRLILIVIVASLFAGILWYFWIPNAFAGLESSHVYIQEGLRSFLILNQSASHFLLLIIKHWGYVLPLLGVSGFAYTLIHGHLKRDPSLVFLTVYSTSLLILIFIALLSPYGAWIVPYFFSIAAFPISLFASIALMKGVDTMRNLTRFLAAKFTISGHLALIPKRRTVLLNITIIALIIMTSMNVHNYSGNRDFSLTLSDFYLGHTKVAKQGLDSNWIVTFQYEKWEDTPSKNVYDALTWIRGHASKQAYVVAFLTSPPNNQPNDVIQRAFPAISERKFIDGIGFNSSIINSPRIYHDVVVNATLGDAYIVIGVHSWQGVDLANSLLESQFLNYANYSPNLFPKVYETEEVQVFHITSDSAHG